MLQRLCKVAPRPLEKVYGRIGKIPPQPIRLAVRPALGGLATFNIANFI